MTHCTTPGERTPGSTVAGPPALTQAWATLLDLAERWPAHWALVGGEAVHLHCWERGAWPSRPTADADVVLGVRSWPSAAADFTAALQELGFRAAGETLSGHQYRWVRDQATIDVLIPRFLGERAQSRRGISGGTLFPTPGAETVLRRVERLPVVLNGRHGVIPRPTLIGMILGKAAAFAAVLIDPGRQRHLIDLATLAALASGADLRHLTTATTTERARLAVALAATEPLSPLLRAVPGGQAGLARLRAALEA